MGSAALLLAAGCLSEPGDRDLRLEIMAEDEAVTHGDSAIFHLEAEGPSLVGVRVTFGDGQDEWEELPLPVYVIRRIAHLYEDEGSYQVEALVADAAGDTLTAQLTVEVVREP